MITEEMIEERGRAILRENKRKYVAKNREKYNRYQREWMRKFKAEHGISYSTYLARKRAEQELIQEQQERC